MSMGDEYKVPYAIRMHLAGRFLSRACIQVLDSLDAEGNIGTKQEALSSWAHIQQMDAQMMRIVIG